MLIKTAFCYRDVSGCTAHDLFFSIICPIWEFTSMNTYFQVKEVVPANHKNCVSIFIVYCSWVFFRYPSADLLSAMSCAGAAVALSSELGKKSTMQMTTGLSLFVLVWGLTDCSKEITLTRWPVLCY